MAISPRKSEVATVMEAIEKETTLEGVAKAAIKASYAALQERPGPGEKLDKGLWVVATSDRLLYGPFGTYNEATKAVINGKIPNMEDGIQRTETLEDGKEGYVAAADVAILPLRGPLSMAREASEFDREARIFSNHLCVHCEQAVNKHDTKTNACPGGAGTKLKQLTL